MKKTFAQASLLFLIVGTIAYADPQASYDWQKQQRAPRNPAIVHANITQTTGQTQPQNDWQQRRGQRGGHVNTGSHWGGDGKRWQRQRQQQQQNWSHGNGQGHYYRNQNYYYPVQIIYPIVPVVPVYQTTTYSIDATTYSDDSYYQVTPSNAVFNDPNIEYSSAVPFVNPPPGGRWEPFGTDIPGNAVEFRTNNGKTTYYCRAYYRGQMMFGELIPDEGCIIQDSGANFRVLDFQVLVS